MLHVIQELCDDRLAAWLRCGDFLVDRAHIAIVPCDVVGSDGEGHRRMSFATDLDTIDAMLDAVARAL